MKNRITALFEQKKQGILNVFFTAGYPRLTDTVPIIQALEQSGVDMVEIGIPFSDPIADGPTIQHSSQIALQNGMKLSLLFEQLHDIRQHLHIPLLLMGYLNPILQYGMQAFCQRAAEVGIDGLILPDLPMYEYEQQYQQLFEAHGLSNIFLISPQTSEERIRRIDALSNGFIYMLSTDSTTGRTAGISPQQQQYFQRISSMNLHNPRLIGFGISDRQSFQTACQYAQGAIIGSAFIKALGREGQVDQIVQAFVQQIKG